MLANSLKKFRPDDPARTRLGGLHMSLFPTGSTRPSLMMCRSAIDYPTA
jgi:hypothetical protein